MYSNDGCVRQFFVYLQIYKVKLTINALKAFWGQVIHYESSSFTMCMLHRAIWTAFTTLAASGKVYHVSLGNKRVTSRLDHEDSVYTPSNERSYFYRLSLLGGSSFMNTGFIWFSRNIIYDIFFGIIALYTDIRNVSTALT